MDHLSIKSQEYFKEYIKLKPVTINDETNWFLSIICQFLISYLIYIYSIMFALKIKKDFEHYSHLFPITYNQKKW